MRALLTLLVAACAPAPRDPVTETPDDSGTSLPSTSSPDDTPTIPDDTAPSGATTPPWELLEVDCTALNPLPVAYETLDWAPTAEDFTFDDDGYLISVSGGNLQRTPYGGPSEILVPNFGDVRGTRFLADDTLVLATIEEQTVLHVDPVTGSREVVASGLQNPNGIAIGIDGLVYVGVTAKIIRFDPAIGDVEVVADLPGKSFDGVSFSPDFTRLYFDEEVGPIHWVDLASDGSIGPPMDGPVLPISGFSILDGMAVDACGNLYVTEMGGTVWRVTPTGDVEVVVNLDEPLAFIPALNFGTGLGGWDPEILYVMDFKGKLYALDVGVPGKWEPHLPVPTPN